MTTGFAVWITGLPAAGKSTLAGALVRALEARGVRAAVLESDSARRILTPAPRYTEDERAVLYGALVWIARLLTEHGVPVILDATGNLRRYRERARQEIPRFLEVHVACPLEVCEARDPKGIYERARKGDASSVPGLQAPYEAPEYPEVVVRGNREPPETGAQRVLAALVEKGWLT
jgi:adenylylsulfate kinase